MNLVFNHDGYGILEELADTQMREQDAADLLVRPLAKAGLDAIDWAILSTGIHNCRTRHRHLYDAGFVDRFLAEAPDEPTQTVDRHAVAKVVRHYAEQPLDLLDLVIKHGHLHGLKVYGCVRLNHANRTMMMDGVPGRGFGSGGGTRKDFRDESVHAYLLEIFEDLLEKGVDGLSLDFERKAPFFPSETPQAERFDACRAFVRKVRRLTDRPIVARVAHAPDKGEPQGQDPERWIREGLVDAIVPATHNHEPDTLDWTFERFLRATAEAPRPCAVWPQIWPTPHNWGERKKGTHPPEAVLRRIEDIRARGADGAYFFNFCCFWPRPRSVPGFDEIFASLAKNRDPRPRTGG